VSDLHAFRLELQIKDTILIGPAARHKGNPWVLEAASGTGWTSAGGLNDVLAFSRVEGLWDWVSHRQEWLCHGAGLQRRARIFDRGTFADRQAQ
jgi:hypothetical protein